jgi:competence protein ComEA
VRRSLLPLLPASWRGARLDPGRPGARALALVAVAAAVLAAIGVWSERPRAEPVGALPAVTVGPDPAASAPPVTDPAAPAAPLVVSVSGKVARPGLVEVPAGARVADVLDAAGGALPGTDLTALNLARRIADGEQVAVGVPPAPDAGTGAAAGAGGGDAAGPAPGGKVDLNTATLQQLDALPGVGPVTAQHILDWRTRNGRFTRIEQLREVDGIGERRFGQLRELVSV